MQDAEVRILEVLVDNKPVSFHDLEPLESAALQRLLSNGMVESRRAYPDNNILRGVTLYRITPEGRVALFQQLEEHDRQKRNRESIRNQSRRRKLKSAAGWMLTVIGTILATLAAQWLIRRLGW